MKPSEVIPNPFLRYYFYIVTFGFGVIILRTYKGIEDVAKQKKD